MADFDSAAPNSLFTHKPEPTDVAKRALVKPVDATKETDSVNPDAVRLFDGPGPALSPEVGNSMKLAASKGEELVSEEGIIFTLRDSRNNDTDKMDLPSDVSEIKRNAGDAAQPRSPSLSMRRFKNMFGNKKSSVDEMISMITEVNRLEKLSPFHYSPGR